MPKFCLNVGLQAEKAKRAKKLAGAQEKLRKMRGETPENTPFGMAGAGHLLSDPGEDGG